MKYLRHILLKLLISESRLFDVRRFVSSATLTQSIQMPHQIIADNRDEMLRELGRKMLEEGFIEFEHKANYTQYGQDMRLRVFVFKP